jgi:hypothetical protein
MSVGKSAATDSGQWYVRADHARRIGHGLHATHAGLNERRANSLALIITTSLLFMLFASALMVGGHAIITPLLRAPAADGENTNRRGDIVYTMPDGTFCQHMTFDNATGQMTSGGINRCDPDVDSGSSRGTGFKWGAH